MLPYVFKCYIQEANFFRNDKFHNGCCQWKKTGENNYDHFYSSKYVKVLEFLFLVRLHC